MEFTVRKNADCIYLDLGISDLPICVRQSVGYHEEDDWEA